MGFDRNEHLPGGGTSNEGAGPSEKEEIYLSVVIPAFNEETRVPGTLRRTNDWCSGNLPTYEVVVVDDGSIDGTLEAARAIAKGAPAIRVLARPHLGKGAAVREGMLHAKGAYVLFMDADGATPLDEIGKLLKKMDEGYPVAIGSRVVRNPKETSVDMPIRRKMAGRLFALLANIFAVPGILDTQCGFKMFRRDAARDLFGRQQCNGFAFDVEILHLAGRLSLPVAEVPINWLHQEGSKVEFASEGPRMLFDVLKVRYLHRKM